MVQSLARHFAVSVGDLQLALVDVDFAVEIIELALKVRADVLNGLIVDFRAKCLEHQIDDFSGAKAAEGFVKLCCEECLDMLRQLFFAIICQVRQGHEKGRLKWKICPGHFFSPGHVSIGLLAELGFEGLDALVLRDHVQG